MTVTVELIAFKKGISGSASIREWPMAEAKNTAD